MASLTHTQTRSLVPTGYQVADTVTASVDIPPEVFVFSVSGSYSRIASVNDLTTLPASLDGAVDDGFSYYRQATVTRVFTQLTDAQDFADAVSGILKALVVDYTGVVTAFAGSDTETLIG